MTINWLERVSAFEKLSRSWNKIAASFKFSVSLSVSELSRVDFFGFLINNYASAIHPESVQVHNKFSNDDHSRSRSTINISSFSSILLISVFLAAVSIAQHLCTAAGHDTRLHIQCTHNEQATARKTPRHQLKYRDWNNKKEEHSTSETFNRFKEQHNHKSRLNH